MPPFIKQLLSLPVGQLSSMVLYPDSMAHAIKAAQRLNAEAYAANHTAKRCAE